MRETSESLDLPREATRAVLTAVVLKMYYNLDKVVSNYRLTIGD